MRLAESRGALRRNLAGEESVWSDEVLDGGIARAVEDLDRLLPQEKLAGVDINFSITSEVWASGTLGTAVTLTNKRLRPHKETVKSTDGNTTYKRDTDYTMNYAEGKITALSTGAIPGSTDLKIDYTILEVYLDTSSYTDLIRIVRVEYPAGEIPADFQSFYTWEDYVVILSRGRESQQKLTEKQHVWLYYHAKHTVPEVEADGSWKPQLDEVVIKGAEGYSLMTKALELRHNAKGRLTTSLAALAQIPGIETDINVSLANTSSQATSASADLSNIDARIDDMLATIAAAGGFLASAGESIVSSLAQAAQAETDISAIDAPLVTATAKLATVDSLVTNVNTLLSNLKTFVSSGQPPLSATILELANATGRVNLSNDKLDEAKSQRNIVDDVNAAAASRVTRAGLFHETKMDSLIGVLNTDPDDLITGVSQGITDSRSHLVAGLNKINQVNIGELVSEMHKRYSDAFLATARIRYDEHLAYLGRLDRVLAQSTGILAEAAEFRAIALSRVATGNVILSEADNLLGQARVYQENVAQRISQSRAYIESGQVSANGASAAVGLVGRGIEQANSYIALARLRLDAASESSELVNAYIASATQYIAMAQAKIAEGNAMRTPIDAILERVSRKIEVARIFQQEADRRLQELALKQQEADRYMALAVGESELADKFEERGILTKVEFMNILNDRAQVRADTSLTPARQQSP